MKNMLLLIIGVLISGCVVTEQAGEYGGIIKTPKLITGNQTGLENQTGILGIQIVIPNVKEVGPNPFIIEKEYLDNQLKALQLQHITNSITLSEYLEVKEEAMNDKIDPNTQENIAINIDEVDTPLKEVQLDYILGKITLNEYLEKENGLINQ